MVPAGKYHNIKLPAIMLHFFLQGASNDGDEAAEPIREFISVACVFLFFFFFSFRLMEGNLVCG